MKKKYSVAILTIMERKRKNEIRLAVSAMLGMALSTINYR